MVKAVCFLSLSESPKRRNNQNVAVHWKKCPQILINWRTITILENSVNYILEGSFPLILSMKGSGNVPKWMSYLFAAVLWRETSGVHVCEAGVTHHTLDCNPSVEDQ